MSSEKFPLGKYVTAQVCSLAMNVLSPERKLAVLSALVEGNSIRSIVRMTGIAKNTIVCLLSLKLIHYRPPGWLDPGKRGGLCW